MAVQKSDSLTYEWLPVPNNDAYRALQLKVGLVPNTLTSLPELPKKTVHFLPLKKDTPAVKKVGTKAESTKDNVVVAAPTAELEEIEEHVEAAELTKQDLEAAVPKTELVAQPTTEVAEISARLETTNLSKVEDDANEQAKITAESREPTTELATDAFDFTPHPSKDAEVDTSIHPPNFVQPHPPYNVYSAKIFSCRELTRPGAEKRTYHFDLDVTDYPEEMGVDFKVGGAIGVSAPNEASVVDELMDLLLIPKHIRDRKMLLKTDSGRWPTVWGDDQARELITTRRDLLTWCSDVQSYPPTKALLRLLAEYTTDVNERKLLMYLCSGEGQGVFCDFRTGPHVTINQLLHAFPSSKPPLDHLLSQLQTLMPRFYSLSNDPHESCVPRAGCSRLIEMAVTIHETSDWRGGQRTGVGSGFFERQAQKFIAAEAKGEKLDLRIPMFKGLMANPLAKEFISDGPMLLIGAGVGVAPFRGFVHRRLRNANCANKVWVLQGVRDSLLDELYSGEWGVHEDEVKKVIQSRKSTFADEDGNSEGTATPSKGKYVQDEVRAQADLVWFIINSLDGRVFVCGSSKGMGEGVEEALIDVAVSKGNLGREGAVEFWKLKKEAGQYIAETW